MLRLGRAFDLPEKQICIAVVPSNLFNRERDASVNLPNLH